MKPRLGLDGVTIALTLEANRLGMMRGIEFEATAHRAKVPGNRKMRCV
jgi:hypothetical protein